MSQVHRNGGGVRLELAPTTISPLAIDGPEPPEQRIQRLIFENPVIIFTKSSCCMCHVMKQLLCAVGVHPTVIGLEEHEVGSLAGEVLPVVFVGGTRVGGLECLVALHLSGQLVPKLAEAGCFKGMML
ncbi:hypothetical protein LguiA_033475 [Lonicera macranthoides]